MKLALVRSPVPSLKWEQITIRQQDLEELACAQSRVSKWEDLYLECRVLEARTSPVPSSCQSRCQYTPKASLPQQYAGFSLSPWQQPDSLALSTIALSLKPMLLQSLPACTLP